MQSLLNVLYSKPFFNRGPGRPVPENYMGRNENGDFMMILNALIMLPNARIVYYCVMHRTDK